MEKRMKWCNTHQRPAKFCKVMGGILLPCEVVDLTDILEVDYVPEIDFEHKKDIFEKH